MVETKDKQPAIATDRLTIATIVARPVVAPISRPIRTAIGNITSAPLVLIDLATREGVAGRSYIFGYSPITLAPLARLINDIGKELEGKPVAPVARQRDLDRRFRLVGWQGLIGMAVGGIDMALWDALACAADRPLVDLLGGEARPIQSYDSFGIVDLKQDADMLARSVEQGFRAIKIKLGNADIDRDVATVSEVRRIIGPATALMVDYNQSLTPPQAISYAERLAEFDLTWLEEPVAAEDIHGHAQVRARSPIPLQTGENWWFPRDMEKAVAAGASDFAMLDVMKIGGVTGWMKAAALAEAASLPVSSHLFVEASAHLLAVTPTAHWHEYVDVASAVLSNPSQPENGTFTAKGPGLGLTWDEKAVARYLV